MKKESKQKVLFLKEEYADGQGTYIYPNGEKYAGEWFENNELDYKLN